MYLLFYCIYVYAMRQYALSINKVEVEVLTKQRSILLLETNNASLCR